MECEYPISVLSYFYPEILEDGTKIYNGKGEKMEMDIHSVLVKMAQGEGVFQVCFIVKNKKTC